MAFTQTIRTYSATLGVLALLGAGYGLSAFLMPANAPIDVTASNAQEISAEKILKKHGPEEPPAASDTAAVQVETVCPTEGGMARLTSQPGSAHSFESAELFSKVSGFLKSLSVDIGSRVQQGELLAEIDVPELNEDIASAEATLEQCRAEVIQAEAQVESAQADFRAAVAKIHQSRAEGERAKAEVELTDKRLQRMRELYGLKAIEMRLVDEQQFQLDAARASQQAAGSSVLAAQQLSQASESRIALAKASLDVMRAKVSVAEAGLKRAKVMQAYTRIVSPYDGVVTVRNFHRGAYVRAPDQGGTVPLLTVDRIDKMRVVVRIPERHVPYIHPGDAASVNFDAYPHQQFQAVVARISATEDPATRSMQVEVDLPNPDGLIRDHMFGRVEIVLEDALKGLTIPSACLVGESKDGKATVFVVLGDTVSLREIQVGRDTGTEVEVHSGLDVKDSIIVGPPGGLTNATRVAARLRPSPSSSPK